MILRPYQTKAVDMLYDWFKTHEGHPCLCMPGGSGKSLVIAKIVQDVMTKWPKMRVLMLVHSKELVQQNYNKLRAIWPNAPVGIYSASIGRKELDEPVIYGSVQSVANVVDRLGKIDLCIVDEAHAISSTESGTYRRILKELDCTVVGLTASPYRLGQGMVTDGDEAIFSDIIEPVTIEELLKAGHLSPLKSKITDHVLETDGIRKSRGDYVAKDMERHWNTEDHNGPVVNEIIQKGKNRDHWLIFCSGVQHAHDVAKEFRRQGVAADAVTGKDPKKVREAKLKAFEEGEIKALCNVGILTTGYDFPELDLIAFLRATTSPGLYLQMAVRGMRVAPSKEDCLVLDFAGVVRKHGPITAIQPPRAKKEGGEAPVKACPECDEIVLSFATDCPSCGYHWPEKEKAPPTLHHDDIMGLTPEEMEVKSWKWAIKKSKSGHEMIVVTYEGSLFDPTVKEYFTVNHPGAAGQMGRKKMAKLLIDAGTDYAAAITGKASPPSLIRYKMDGKYYRVTEREWK